MENIILCIETPKDAMQSYQILGMNLLNKQDTELTHRNLFYFYTPAMNNQKEIKEKNPIIISSKRIKYLGIILPRKQKTCALNRIRH